MKNFQFSGMDTVEMAKKYGTPLYLMSQDYIEDRCKEIRDDFLSKHEDTNAVYASKAFLTKEMARIIKKEGLGIDVVSGGELYTVLQVDFPRDKIIFHGSNKSIDEIEMAIKNNVGRIILDHIEEITLVEDLAKKYNKNVDVLFRISPGVDSHTHKYIQTGQVDSKFGIPLEEETIKKAMVTVLNTEHVKLKGFHFHIGSQILENQTHIKAVKVIMKLAKKLKDEYGFITKELNTGGGYGIKYADSEKRKTLAYYTDLIMEEVEKKSQEYGLERPKITIEPGRWIVGEAGITLYTIGAIKEIPGIRTYVSIDGGMTDNPRPSLYQAKYEALVANRIDEKATELVTIAGKCCESGDILIKDLKIPKVKRGDILAVLSTGAYNYSMANNYNKTPRPPVVMINKGKDRLIVKRESYEDLIKNQI